jgi:NADH-quinone oxidoreductase subunit L
MPQTFATFAVGWLAICGIPPLSGFFSKDEILWLAYGSSHGSTALWALGAVTAVMTAFYMTRLFWLTFMGKPRFDEKHLGHAHAAHSNEAGHSDHHAPAGIHESPLVMTGPLMVLALLSAIGGFIGIPHMSWLAHWLDPVIPAHHELAPGVSPSMEWVLMGVSTLGAVLGIFVGFNIYKDLPKATALKQRFALLHRTLDNKWYIDEIFEAIFVHPIHFLSIELWRKFDIAVIDRIVLGFGRVSERSGQTVRAIQNGSIQVYALMLLLGVLVSVGYLIYGMA